MFVFLDKPAGCTSYDCVEKLKRLYPDVKVGHAGTLDPLATGLLIIAVDDTKQLKHFVGLSKGYTATIDFSQQTDTRDSDYRNDHETVPTPKKIPTSKEIEALLDTIIGTHPLPLPPFSAKKRKGKKLYEYAREGNPVHMEVSMDLHSYRILAYDYPTLSVALHVGSGTYIRSIAHRLGDQLGVGGVITELRRTRIGKFSVPTTT